MTNGQKIDLIKYRIQAAEDNLEVAKNTIQSNKLNIALRELYYAFFQMALALLLVENLQFKTHRLVLSNFSDIFINRKHLFEPSVGRLFNRLMTYRHKADYAEFFNIEQDEINDLLLQTENFIIKAKNYLENWINQLTKE